MPTDDADDSSTEHDQHTRRDVLATTGAIAVTPSALATDAAGDEGEDEPAIPAPFDAVPTIDEPTDFDREIASASLPPRAIPDEGPMPDYCHQHTVTREIVVPEWGLEAARWRLQSRLDRDGEDYEGNELPDTPDELDQWRIEEALMGYAQLRERFVTPDRRDAVDVVLQELEEG